MIANAFYLSFILKPNKGHLNHLLKSIVNYSKKSETSLTYTQNPEGGGESYSPFKNTTSQMNFKLRNFQQRIHCLCVHKLKVVYPPRRSKIMTRWSPWTLTVDFPLKYVVYLYFRFDFSEYSDSIKSVDLVLNTNNLMQITKKQKLHLPVKHKEMNNA